MKKHEPLNAERYLDIPEIEAHLSNIEYIILAAPSVRKDAKAPIHFTIFLNTQDVLPPDIQNAIFDKFIKEHKITQTHDTISKLEAVAFAKTSQNTLMPMHLFKESDRKAFPHTIMHIIDFEGDSTEFEEVKQKNLTGWSYSYNNASIH